MSSVVEYSRARSSLEPVERRWLEDAENGGEPWAIRELAGGAAYLHLPKVGSVTRTRRAPWVGHVFAAAAFVTVPAGVLALLGLDLLAVVVPLLLLFVVVFAYVVRLMMPNAEPEQGHHGILLTPDALVVRRPDGITRIARSTVTGIDDETRYRALVQPWSDPASAPQSAHRRLQLRLTDGQSSSELVVADVEGEQTVVRGSGGLTPLQDERLDALKARLDAWME